MMAASSSKNIHVINSVLVILVFLAALMLTRDIITMNLSRKKPATATENTPAPGTPALRDINSYAPILEKNPFGSPLKLTPIVSERNAGNRPSPDAIVLMGTAVGPPELSYAIFKNPAGSGAAAQEIFTYGEDVFGYGTLTKIEKEWVELTEGAELYKINLIDIKAADPRAENTAKSQNLFVKRVGEKQYLLDQNKVQAALNNPEQILTDARLLPNIQNGNQEGFRISEVKPGGLYWDLGLRNGDVLLRVNDLEISNPEIAIQAMSAMRGMNRVNLDIIRNGAKVTMNYQIR